MSKRLRDSFKLTILVTLLLGGMGPAFGKALSAADQPNPFDAYYVWAGGHLYCIVGIPVDATSVVRNHGEADE